MRRRTRGRGRGGGANSRNNSNASAAKTVTIQEPHQRQPYPYARQIRGGRSSKTVTSSYMRDKDNHYSSMTNTTPTPPNGSYGSYAIFQNNRNHDTGTRTNGTNGSSGEFYLHKKFKKLTPSTDSPKNGEVVTNGIRFHGLGRNGISISLPSTSSQTNTNTLSGTGINGDSMKLSSNLSEISSDILNNNAHINGVSSSSGSVYKPKFRIATSTEKVQVAQDERLEAEGQSQIIQTIRNPVYNMLQPSQSSPAFTSTVTISTAFSNHNPTTTTITSSPGKIQSTESRIDRQSLDDRISKIITDNQSILATWPEHLSKRSKGHGGRHPSQSSTSKNGISSPNLLADVLPLHRTLESRAQSLGFDLPSYSHSTSANSDLRNQHKSHLVRSNSDVGHLVQNHRNLNHRKISAQELSGSVLAAATDSGFTVPKKRRRLSPPLSGILCGGEVSEMPPTDGVMNLSNPSKARNYYQHQDMDMTLRVSNCGNSGAKVTIRGNNGLIHTAPSSSNSPANFRQFNDDSSNSSSTSSSTQHSPPKIRIRQDSILEIEPVPSPGPQKKPRGRPPRKSKQEFVLQVPPQAAMTNPVEPIIVTESYPNHSLLLAMDKKSPLQLITKDNQVPVASASPPEKIEPSSLLLQTVALNPKRPTFLALKPMNHLVKKLESSVLPSPDTPRGAKTYNQMHINGHAYTYLGFKVSTKPSYTTLFKPQPMFVPQETDAKLSMYSNWQPRPKDPLADVLKISTNDSSVNGRRSPQALYISARGTCSDTLTVNSPVKDSAPITTPLDGTTSSFLGLGNEILMSSPPVRLVATPPVLSPPAVLIPQPQQPAVARLPSSSPLAASSKLSPVQIDQLQRVSPAVEPRPSSATATVTQESAGPSISVSTFSMKQQTSVAKNESSSPSLSVSSNNSPNVKQHKKLRKQRKQSSKYFNAAKADDSSDSSDSSMEERTAFHPKPRFQSVSLSLDGKDESLDFDKPLSLAMGRRERPRSQSVSLSSPSAILHNLDNPRVRVMEGGFESNENYTYVRGRGRGRYVCESCGIRCKKPSMLRKHLKTHTDLRPYTCKLCNFSFKTKGNLTKHQKSKSHHKKCIGLGIHPNSSRSLEMTGPISDTNTTDDSDDDDDEDDKDMSTDSNDDDDSYNIEAETDRFEKEIALSLLDLSQMHRFPDEQQKQAQVTEASKTVTTSASIIPTSDTARFSPGMQALVTAAAAEKKLQIDESEIDAPIDLSVKPVTASQPAKSASILPLFIQEPQMKRIKLDKQNGRNGIDLMSVKSMEIVGEAQRWEPEEDFLRNGCLNLTKIRNQNLNQKNLEVDIVGEKTEMVYPPEFACVKIERHESITPEPISDKPQDFEYEIKRRRMSSTGSTGAHFDQNQAVILNHTSTPSPAPSASSADANAKVLAKPQRLHQPWLSPQGQGPAFTENSPVWETNERDRTESFNSTGDTSSNCGSVVGFKDEPDNGAESEIESGAQSSSEPPALTNSRLYPGLAGLKPQAEFRQPSGAQAFKDEGKAECDVCGKVFARASQLNLHMNIHFLERPFRCDPCGVSFRTKGHLVKHRRSSSHDCKVYLTEAWGVANEENPRPFKCPECKIAFRIHGHLAKHLRSKMHIMRMECLGKLPFGIYFEMEKSGLNLNEIDTTDCDMSLVSLQNVARKIYGETWMERLTLPIEEEAV